MKPSELYYKWDCDREHSVEYVLKSQDAKDWINSLAEDFREIYNITPHIGDDRVIISAKFNDPNHEVMLVNTISAMFKVEIFIASDKKLMIYLEK